MLGKIFSVLTVMSFVFALLLGNTDELSRCIASAANDTVELSLSLCGMLCLWCGVIRVLDKAGATALISRLCRPILRLIYPTAHKLHIGEKEISANFAANLLGLGNAALPSGLAAMNALSSRPENRRLLCERKTFAIMSTIPPQLIPTTLISLRTAFSSAAPFEILLPIWLCTLLTFSSGALICRLCEWFETVVFEKRKARSFRGGDK